MSTKELITVGPNELLKLEGVVSKEQCQQWMAAALENEDEWVTRFEFIHSYGHAWYLDIEHGLLHQYHAAAKYTNALLEALPDLVPTLTKLSTHLVAPDGSTGLPARSRSSNLGPYWADAGIVMNTHGTAGQVHADFEGIAPYPEKLFDPNTRAYSAVLSLVRPAHGGGLKIWLKRHLGNDEPSLKDVPTELVEYDVGSAVLFDSFCFHQIQASQFFAATPYRAVAAIHFLYMDKPHPHWEYWF